MANNPGETPSDDLLNQILGFPSYFVGDDANLAGNEAARTAMMLQLGSPHVGGMGMGLDVGAYGAGGFPPGLSLEGNGIGFTGASGSGNRFHRDDVVDSHASSSLTPGFRGQTMTNAVPYPPAIRPRVRARRGQATDPHSIAERLRRERIAEKVRALQDLVPGVNKTDRAAMYDEIVDYVKFLEIQVKVLRISRLGVVGAVAPLVTDIPLSAMQDEGGDGGRSQPAWEKWSSDGTEQKVAKLMEENVGAAMQFLQSKALCLVPISLATAIYHTHPTENTTTLVNPESNPHP